LWFIPTFTFVLVGVLTLHHLIWNLIHEEMHIPKRWWIRNFPGFRYLERYHWLHHKYSGKNYNIVLPFFDWIMGTYIGPTSKDQEQMRKELC
jgi:sterol desaturase/sphingolipid hydroxylase (fatty acid hydroxylase superfamily)